MRYYTISQYASLLGIHPQTLRKHERLGIGNYIKPIRTSGNHRRYPIPDVIERDKLRVGYARVSCSDQKADLPRQSRQAEKLRPKPCRLYGHRLGLKLQKARFNGIGQAAIDRESERVGFDLQRSAVTLW